MSKVLEAWLEHRHAGQFIFESNGRVQFRYDDDAPETPISLSLPRDSLIPRYAAGRFLDNLLPDSEHMRHRLALAYNTSDASPFSLLTKAGGDLAGGLLLLPEGKSPWTGPPLLNPILDRDLADRINSIKLDADAWLAPQTPARFSLAGTQGKFAMAQIEGDWYWSNETAPSTHIVKPGAPRLVGIEQAEIASLALAGRVGIKASSAQILQVEDQQAFLVERFDREVQAKSVYSQRLHAEDLAQAMGYGPDQKYNITFEQAFRKLSEVDSKGLLGRTFLDQVIFNTLIGNADAHAKNYSVLLRLETITLAPLYDAVPVGLYGEYDQNLAMRIAGARQSQAVSLSHWRKLARRIDVDPDELSARVQGLATAVGEQNAVAWSALAGHQSALLTSLVDRNVAKALSNS